jgi:lambda family phage portal protein
MATRGFLAQVFADARMVAQTMLAAGLVPSRIEGAVRAFSGAPTYDGARRSRSREDWTTRDIGPNSVVGAAGPNLRARVRDLVRNNPLAARALEVIAGSLVGSGIMPRAVETGSRRSTRLQKQADAAWREWCKAGAADLEGQHTLNYLVYLIVRGWLEGGECFVRRRWDPAARPVPVRLEVLEADMLDDTKTASSIPGGGSIWQGIELDATGRRAAYWFRTSHPGESNMGLLGISSVRVPADEVIHVFQPLRPRQLRGVPFLAPVMTTMRDLGDYESHHLVRKKMESMVVAVVTPPSVESAIPELQRDADGKEIALVPSALNSRGELVGELRPGAVLSIENGGEVAFNNPQISANYDTYKKAMQTSIAVGCQMTYENMTGDLANVNYSSYRAGHIQFNGYIDRLQWNLIIPVLLDRLWDWCQEGAYLTGAVGRPDVPREWAVPKRLSVDPKKDADADLAEIRAGLALREDKLAERGEDPVTFYERKAAEDKSLDDHKIKLDSDPRHVNASGSQLAQTQAKAAPDPLADDEPDPAEDTA